MDPDGQKVEQDSKKFNLLVKFELMRRDFDYWIKGEADWRTTHEKEANERAKVLEGILTELKNQVKDLYDKANSIKSTVDKLPCGAEYERIKSLEIAAQVSTTWKIMIVGSILGLVGLGIMGAEKFGAHDAIISRNTARILNLEDIHMKKDINEEVHRTVNAINAGGVNGH